jgi:hypothetical protein
MAEVRHVWLLATHGMAFFWANAMLWDRHWTLCGWIVQQAATAQGWQYDRHLTEVVTWS